MSDGSPSTDGPESAPRGAGSGGCEHCPSPRECACPDTSEVCRTGACVCGQECPCPGHEPEPDPRPLEVTPRPPLPPQKPVGRGPGNVLGFGSDSGAGEGRADDEGPGRRGCIFPLMSGVVVLVLLALGLFLFLRNGDDGETNQSTGVTSTTTTTPAAATPGPTTPPVTWADIMWILDAWGITDPPSRQAVHNSLRPVDDAPMGRGAVPMSEVPDYLLPAYDGSAEVLRLGARYRMFVTEAGGPLPVAGLQLGLAFARNGSTLSEPEADPIDFIESFPHSSFYYFDATSESGDLHLLDPVHDWAAVPTGGMFAMHNKVVAMLIPTDELQLGGDYAMQMFFRNTPAGEQPSEADPTIWSSWTRTIEQ